MTLRILASLALLTVASAAACSSSSNNGFGETGGPDGGTVTGEGGTSGDATTESGGGSLPYVGSVTADKAGGGTTLDGGTAASVFVLAASFFPTPTTTTTATCPSTGTPSGSCCYLPPGVAGDAGTGTDGGTGASAESAGSILFKDGTANVASLSQGSSGGYFISSAPSNPSVKWTPGDMLEVSASGATVQAFSGALTTVDDITGVVPALSITKAATVPISSDLMVTWAAGNGTNVVVTLAAIKSKAGDGLITCQGSDSGSVAVPTALLSKFTSGDTGLLTVTRQNATKVTGPNATVELIGTTSASGVLKYM